MTPELLELVPTELLAESDTRDLRLWLNDRGQRMTLLQLDEERRRRGITPPIRKAGDDRAARRAKGERRPAQRFNRPNPNHTAA